MSSLHESRRILTVRSTPTPVKITLAGENTFKDEY
jgi:hypothetical protein